MRLLNSAVTPGKEPLSIRVVRRHQDDAGLLIGDDGRIHLLKYAGWLRSRWQSGQNPAQAATADLRDDYAAMKEAARSRNEERSRAGRDIGDIPAVVNPERRAVAAEDLEHFASAYFSALFYLPSSDCHRTALCKMQRAIRRGGHFAHAMPRGFGKTTLAMVACLWAVLYGYRRWAALIAASSTKGEALLDLLKIWLETNPLLLEDFPEVCYPIRRLGRITGRAPGQLCHGQPTRIEWGAARIVLPTIAESVSRGAVISACGLKGSDIRGQLAAMADGSSARPDLAVVDDPQTRESAFSTLQCDQREATLAGDVMGMAGPGRDIAVFVCVTVIAPNDLADRILDRKKHPEFQGERTKMLSAMPGDMKLWDEYSRLRAASLDADGDGSEATAFYGLHRAAMDAGAVVAWLECCDRNELSGLQHAMNWYYRDRRSFLAECQNEPEIDQDKRAALLTVENVSTKINGLACGRLPLRAAHSTAYIDVHDQVLYWLVAAWEPNYTGYVIDYGTYPKQPTAFFAQANPPVKLLQKHPAASKEATILAGLEKLVDVLFATELLREDDAAFHVGRLLIDARYETDAVKTFCRRSPHAASIMPAMGFYLRPGPAWTTYFANKPGGQTGYHWRIPPPEGGQRYVLMDSDFWKSFIADRLLIAQDDPGGLSLFGRHPREHEPYAEQCCAEQREWRQIGDAGKWHWEQKPGRPDNHWWDCLYGSAVAASLLGVRVPGVQEKEPAKRKLCFNF